MRKFITTQGRTGHARPAVLAALGAALLFGCTADVGTSPDVPLTVANVNPLGAGGYDLNDPTLSPATVNGAIWTFGVDFGVGTGVIDPFLSIQNNGSEEGFNTDANQLPLDTKKKEFTDALPLNNIPIIKYDGGLFREIILEANEANSGIAAFFSIDFFNLYICDDVGVATASQVSDFAANPNCVLIYDFAGKVGFATDGLTSGSGQGLDYDILIPEANFDAFQIGQVTVDDCPYNPLAADCGLYVILHTSMGGFGGDWVTGSTFEEYSTVLQPFVEVEKTAVPTFDRDYTWQIEKSVIPTDINLFDGQSQDADYTVTVTRSGPQDSNFNVSGAVTITNPSDSDAEITSIVDRLQPGDIEITLDCATPFTLAGGASTVCNYSYDFGDVNPGPTEFTNTVEIELAGLAVTTGESESFAFSDPTTVTNETANVTDLFDGNLTDLATGISAGDVFNYSHTFMCGDDEGGNPNTAKVIGDGGQEAEASANVNVNCLDLTVTKDANTALERTYLWDITKTVTPETWDLFDGDDGTSDYTVTAVPNGNTDAGWSVSGSINVTNPNASSVWITNIADVVSGVGAATVSSCMVGAVDIAGPAFADPGYVLAAGATITCAYTSALPDGADRTNTATATAKPAATGGTKDFTGNAPVSFAGVQLTEVNKTVNVTDNLEGALGTADHGDGPTPFNYSSKFACENDNDRTVDNIAKIVETDQTASASVTINCHQLAVTKTAETEWTRTWTWDIDKDIDATHFLDGTYDAGTNTATVLENTALEVKYDITLDATSVNSLRNVAGSITVSNAGNPIDAVIETVADVVSPALAATVTCGALPATIAAGETLDCTYGPLELPDLTQRVNTATATQTNFSYASDGTASNAGTTDYSGVADVIFADDPTFEIDECVDVVDVLKQGGVQVGDPTDLGQLCAGDGPLPHTFTVLRTFGGTGGIPLVCGDNVFDNMGMFTTNDTGTQGQDPATINIFVECIVGCTLTQGYWKTHNNSFHGGASKKADLTWGLVGPLAEQEEFFLSGDTWYGVFWTAPKGNAYYNLAHQYMAATLNQLAGATGTPEVDAALAFATDYFTNNDPSDSPRGRDARALRDAATVLDDYNNGLIGPGHCTEN